MKPLLLPEMPELPEKAQGEPVGSYWNWPAPTSTCSKPGSPIEEVLTGVHGDLVDEGGVVAAGTVQSLEGDRVRPGGDGERGSGVALVRRARWCEGADDGAVDQHVEVLLGRLELPRWAASKVST